MIVSLDQAEQLVSGIKSDIPLAIRNRQRCHRGHPRRQSLPTPRFFWGCGHPEDQTRSITSSQPSVRLSLPTEALWPVTLLVSRSVARTCIASRPSGSRPRLVSEPGPDVVSNYINQVRSAIANSPLSGVPVGHVDTWTAWVNGSNDAVIKDSDFIGMDAYPYLPEHHGQTPSTMAARSSLRRWPTPPPRPKASRVWITETGWPP